MAGNNSKAFEFDAKVGFRMPDLVLLTSCDTEQNYLTLCSNNKKAKYEGATHKNIMQIQCASWNLCEAFNQML